MNELDNNDTIVQEGKANIFCPPTVFYNPVQQFNRDLTILVLSTFSETESKELRIIEALAASGLRSIRFSLEIPNVKCIIANDFSEVAVQYIDINIKENNVQNIVCSSCMDARLLLYKQTEPNAIRPNVIDLDPYGTAVPFIDAAVQSVEEGGMLCITCTDMAVLCGNTPESCFAKYGSVSIRGAPFVHENAIRILLHTISTSAGRYGRYIKPQLSISVDFYIRVFVRVFHSKFIAKEIVSNTGSVFLCGGCDSFHIQTLTEKLPTKNPKLFKYNAAHGPVVSKKCEICYHNHRIAGPLWVGPLHNKDFILALSSVASKRSDEFQTFGRIQGLLGLLQEELVDVPFFYDLSDLCSCIHATSMKLSEFRSAILNAGYKVSPSHCKPVAVKTTAPPEVIWAIMRNWAEKPENVVNEKWLESGSVSLNILNNDQLKDCIEVNFATHSDAVSLSKVLHLKRFPIHPPFWGPKSKPKNIPLEEKIKKPKTE